MNREEIKTIIVNSIKTAQEKGYTLVRGCWYDKSEKGDCCCALGSVFVANDEKMYDYSPRLQEKFGVDYIWINDFIHAFDGTSISWSSKYKEAKELGEDIAKEFNPPIHLEWIKIKDNKEVKEEKVEAKEEPKEEKAIETKEEPKEEIKEEVKE